MTGDGSGPGRDAAARGHISAARAVFLGAVARLDPAARFRDCAAALDWRGERERNSNNDRGRASERERKNNNRVIAIAAGKAAARALAGAAEALGERLCGGVCVVPAPPGHSADGDRDAAAGAAHADAHAAGDAALDGDERAAAAGLPPGVAVLRAAHPEPDHRSVAAARAVLAAVRAAPPGAEIAALISGGASSLLALPAPGLSLDDKLSATRALHRAGADIHALNTVRRHLSAIKGGRLAAASPVPVTTLIASDVIGDDPAAVGSGPTVADPTTFHDACAVIARHVGWDAVPAAVRRHLQAGSAGRIPDTPAHPRPGDRVVLAASIDALVDGAVAAARDAGMTASVLARGVTGDVAGVAPRIAAHVHRLAAAGRRAPACWVASGEPTVALPAVPGTGGRAQQLALLVAREIAGTRGVAVLVAGSDGVDGNSHAAGAVVTGDTWDAITRAGADPARALDHRDATPALDAAGALVITGPTGVNHADLIVIVG